MRSKSSLSVLLSLSTSAKYCHNAVRFDWYFCENLPTDVPSATFRSQTHGPSSGHSTYESIHISLRKPRSSSHYFVALHYLFSRNAPKPMELRSNSQARICLVPFRSVLGLGHLGKVIKSLLSSTTNSLKLRSLRYICRRAYRCLFKF
jgi:hypothetical protein